VEKFVMLAHTLSESASVAFILGPAESAIEKRLSEYDFPVFKDLELGTLAGIARLAAGFVGNDSGVSHLAAAVGAPGVVIYGPTDPARWRPLGRIAVLGPRELDSIEPKEVAAAVTRICRRRDAIEVEKSIRVDYKNRVA
jgi:ADP-heptose:LPS heptosyltransferase